MMAPVDIEVKEIRVMGNDRSKYEFDLGKITNWNQTIISKHDFVDFVNFATLVREGDVNQYKIYICKDVDDANTLHAFMVRTDKNVVAHAVVLKDSGALIEFIVDSKYRGKGFGTRFLKAIMAMIDIKSLEVAADNGTAIRMYEACGFKPKVIHRVVYEDIIMEI